MQFASIIKDDSVTVMINGQIYELFEDHQNYEAVLKAISEKRYDEIEVLVSVKKAVASYSKGLIEIIGGEVYYKGAVLHNYVAGKLIRMYERGIDISPLVLFIENLMLNPSFRAVNELYGFMEKHNLPLTDDGHFLAYKKVRADFKDIHSGTFDNSVGNVLEMERNQVNEDKNQTCSSGLHFCGFSYLSSFGSNTVGDYNVVILKIHPRDVVSIPSDYNDAKGRTCRYEVIGLHSKGISEDTLTADEVDYKYDADEDLEWESSEETDWADSGCYTEDEWMSSDNCY